MRECNGARYCTVLYCSSSCVTEKYVFRYYGVSNYIIMYSRQDYCRVLQHVVIDARLRIMEASLQTLRVLGLVQPNLLRNGLAGAR
jgi:hypothetical protein